MVEQKKHNNNFAPSKLIGLLTDSYYKYQDEVVANYAKLQLKNT